MLFVMRSISLKSQCVYLFKKVTDLFLFTLKNCIDLFLVIFY